MRSGAARGVWWLCLGMLPSCGPDSWLNTGPESAGGQRSSSDAGASGVASELSGGGGPDVDSGSGGASVGGDPAHGGTRASTAGVGAGGDRRGHAGQSHPSAGESNGEGGESEGQAGAPPEPGDGGRPSDSGGAAGAIESAAAGGMVGDAAGASGTDGEGGGAGENVWISFVGVTADFGHSWIEEQAGQCPREITYSVGVPPPSFEERGVLEQHGERAEIDCTVAPLTAETFFVSVRLLGGISRDPNSMGKSLNLNLTGQLDVTTSTQAVELGSFTPDTGSLVSPTDPNLPGCLVTEVYQLVPGEMHVDFDCPLLLGIESACALSGTLVVTNCRAACNDACEEMQRRGAEGQATETTVIARLD
jgi:hypothetical protein